VVGSRSESEVVCCSDFLGSCRELTADFFFCKMEIQRVSSQLQTEGCGDRKFNGVGLGCVGGCAIQ
jgi:hypothetical protein